MNIVSDAKVTQSLEQSFIGLVIYTFKIKGIWQYLNLGNIMFSLILLLIAAVSNYQTNGFTIITFIISTIVFVMNIVSSSDEYYRSFKHQTGGSISD